MKVCKIFFLDTLGVSEQVIQTALAKKTTVGVVLPDNHGKHDHHKKVDEDLKNDVRCHINSFSRVPSHYCRKDSRKQYLDPQLNLGQIYCLYVEDSTRK